MAYHPHSLVAFGGTIHSSGGNDIWQCGVRVVSTTGQAELADNAGYMADIQAALSAWFTNNVNFMRSDCTLEYLKVNAIGADGKYSDAGNTNRHDYTTHPAGAAAGVGPAFLSLCLTWETAVARGRASKGRIYPPNSTIPVAGGDEVAGANLVEISTSGTRLLELLRNRANEGRGAFPVVASSINGAFHQITRCSVDSVYDVQRKRKNAVHGARGGTDWTP